MGVYVITGGTTGIGAATRLLLEDWGHEVFNIDYKGGDFQADLSCEEGVRAALKAVEERYPDGIDGLISNAGVGPTAPPETIFALNFYAGTTRPRYMIKYQATFSSMNFTPLMGNGPPFMPNL